MSSTPHSLTSTHLTPDASPNSEVRQLSGSGFHNINLTGYEGEIIGLAGVAGNGQSELLRAIAGLEHFDGEVVVGGTTRQPRELLTEAAMMPADPAARRSHDAQCRFGENAAVGALKKFTRGLFLSRKRENDAVQGVFQQLSVKTSSPEALVSSLSGGNQQKSRDVSSAAV